jgi:hypothetical protein
MDTEENKIKYLDAEEMATMARRYYAARFPNPQRLGCPPAGEIIGVVRRRQAPGQVLREHLFECSECFGEYRQALAQCWQPEPEKSSWRNRLVSFVALKPSAVVTMTAVMILSWLLFVRRWIKRVILRMERLVSIGAWKIWAATAVLLLSSLFIINELIMR